MLNTLPGGRVKGAREYLPLLGRPIAAGQELRCKRKVCVPWITLCECGRRACSTGPDLNGEPRKPRNDRHAVMQPRKRQRARVTSVGQHGILCCEGESLRGEGAKECAVGRV
jgi:hypothetical protein